MLWQGIVMRDIKDKTVLEIGCGVGYFHQKLLLAGARKSVGVDLSAAMLEQARALSQENGLDSLTEYIQGDFLDLNESITPSDITVLDKVVCCYPDANGLLRSSLSLTRDIYALSYPRPRWFIKILSRMGALLFWAIGCDFRSYIHNPEQIQKAIMRQGFSLAYEDKTPFWIAQVFSKNR